MATTAAEIAVETADARSSPQSLHSAVHARRADYVRPHKIRVKIGSWNVAACPGTDKDLASWFVEGKGVDRRHATVDVARNPAIEREQSDDSLVVADGASPDPNAVRLVGGEKIGLYVLGLQEVEDLNVAASYVTRVLYADTTVSPVDRWTAALQGALPHGYKRIVAEQMSGLMLLIYAAPDVADAISNVSFSSVGTGLMGYAGNKGAVSARIVLGETTRMTFVNCHLASGHEATYLERRIWDVGQIVSRTQFKPVSYHGPAEGEPEKIGDEDFAFWFGDLNFRLDGLPGTDIRRLLTLHTKGEYDVSKKTETEAEKSLGGEDAVVLRSSSSTADSSSTSGRSATTTGTGSTKRDGDDQSDDFSLSLPDPDEFLPDPSDDPASLQATLDSLLPHDQLRRLIKQGRVFHDGWREGPITFLPSYKYDVGTIGLFDTSEKKRSPSWCDRILYRTRTDKEAHERKIKELQEARRRDEEMRSQGLDEAAADDEVLFDYDPDTDGDEQPITLKNEDTITGPSADSGSATIDAYDENDDGGSEQGANEEVVMTKEGFTDRMHLDIYTSHQRVQSSDHKPVISVFTLDYDGAVPELKAKVHAEVARELDRAENEGRPTITIVVDTAEAFYRERAASIGEDGSKRRSASRTRSPSAAADEGEAIDFGPVSFLRKKTYSVTIANTGRVRATLSFVEKPTTEEIGSLSPHWLTTAFVHTDFGDQTTSEDSGAEDLGKEVALEPGDTVKATVELLVDDIGHATRLNYGQASLEDVLVLRVALGRDHFIPVRATWTPTCIGRSMDELIRVPDGGIRAFIADLEEKKAKETSNGRTHGDKNKRRNSKSSRVGSIPYDMEVRCAAPKELFKLTEAVETLTERALADEQMLAGRELPKDKKGWPLPEDPTSKFHPSLVAAVVEMLDRDKPVADAFEPETPSVDRLEVVAEVLLLFLRGLTDGIVPISLWTRIEQASLPSLALGGAGGGGGGNSNRMPSPQQDEDDKAAILDILATAPNHNISFVFLTTTLAKVLAELSPLSRADIEALRQSSPLGGLIPRRSLSFRRSGNAAAAAEALAALERRQAKEKRFADILARAGVCRAPPATKDKERKANEEMMRAVLELFLRRSRDELLGE